MRSSASPTGTNVTPLFRSEETFRMKAEDWLQSSIMSKRAVAKGAAGTKHSVTIEQQGKFHYVYGPYAKPTLSIDPGGIVVVETEDAFGGVITSESDSPTAKLT